MSMLEYVNSWFAGYGSILSVPGSCSFVLAPAATARAARRWVQPVELK